MTYDPCRPHTSSPQRLSLAAVATLTMLAAAGVGRPAEPARTAGPATVQWDEAAARHLLSRTSFGGSPEEAKRLAAMPMPEAVKELLDRAAAAKAPPKPDWVRDAWINYNRRYADMTAEEYLVVLRRNGARNAAENNDLRAWWVRHMATTDAPLRESLTLFWHGHFTSATGKALNLSEAFYHQNQTWRRHAMGNFREFLEAVTLDPAMLVYLDMEESDKAHPTENYARELLELFTLGVGNYTEKDILETARAFTGWTLDQPEGTVRVKRETDPTRARSVLRDGLVPKFVPGRHDTGDKTILGKTGKFGVKDMLDILVSHPACGRHVAGRLVAYYGAHDPDGRLKERMARAFTDGKYEIRPMLEVLFTSPEFYAPEARGSQVKSPVRLLVGALRELKPDGEITPAVAQLTVPLGQELFNPPTVKGWPGGTTWVSASTLALRGRLGEPLVDGHLPDGTDPLGRQRGTVVPADPVAAASLIRRLEQIDAERRQAQAGEGIKLKFDAAKVAPAALVDEPEKLADFLLAKMVVTPVRPATRTGIVTALKDAPTAERVPLAVKLILASPEYQME
jgi:uncharacterized protein (DUF1800 family)